jgi:simple sugar transport system permease protein
LHLGVLVAIGVAILIWFVLYKTTFGFELRMVGLNPSAARYAGIKVGRMTILTMMIAGSLAGLAGAIQVLGVTRDFQTNQNLTLGFDSIAVSLLAGNNPIGIIPSAFLFGAMDAGGPQMQLSARVPAELIKVVQALILMFVAADQIIRGLYRIRGSGAEKLKISTTWGQR